jgi:EpsD family peptidyl-prolyl cis-trans isomerase
MIERPLRALLLAMPLLSLAACTAPEGAGADARLAARVNGTAITVQALGAQRGGALQKSLEQVIDRELLVQQALQARLDRGPQVQARLDGARREVLAQAWLDLAAARGGQLPRGEVAAFYEDNPALFAQRRIYRFQELAVSAPQEKLDLVKAELAGAKDLEEVAGWLKWRNVKVAPLASVTQAAEQLPLSYLPQLSRMKEGEMAVFSSPLGATVIQLVAVQEAPLTREQAAPLIEQFLAGRKRLELAAAEVRKLRQAASIEYVGEFKR